METRLGTLEAISLYLRNVDKSQILMVPQRNVGGWGGAGAYDHTRNASANNPGSHDLENKFRCGGKEIAVSLNILKAGIIGIIEVRIVPNQLKGHIRLVIHGAI